MNVFGYFDVSLTVFYRMQLQLVLMLNKIIFLNLRIVKGTFVYVLGLNNNSSTHCRLILYETSCCGEMKVDIVKKISSTVYCCINYVFYSRWKSRNHICASTAFRLVTANEVGNMESCLFFPYDRRRRKISLGVTGKTRIQSFLFIMSNKKIEK